MVFTWVSTGIIEPFIPVTPSQYGLPSVHAVSGAKETNTDPATVHFKEPTEREANALPREVQSFKESSKIHRRGDTLQFVYEIMTENVDSLYEYDKLIDAIRKFRSKRYRHIPIVNHEKKLVGILSDRDTLRLMADMVSPESKISEYMVKRVLTASSDTRIREAAYVMVQERIGCLPAVNKDFELVGILTRSDILRSILRKPPLELFV